MSDIAKKIESTGAIKTGKFKLSDGSLTDYYIDKYFFETKPEVLSDIADEISRMLSQENIDVVAGPALGAVPLVTAVSLKMEIPSAFVRKNQNHYGKEARIEGTIKQGQKVAILEDVTTRGNGIVETADLIRDVGGVPERLITVVDRNASAVENANSSGYELEYLTRIGENLHVETA